MVWRVMRGAGAGPMPSSDCRLSGSIGSRLSQPIWQDGRQFYAAQREALRRGVRWQHWPTHLKVRGWIKWTSLP